MESHSKYYLTASIVPFHLCIYFIKVTFLSSLFPQLEMILNQLGICVVKQFQRPLPQDRSYCCCPLTCPEAKIAAVETVKLI